MVVEDESGIVGYALAALNVKSYYQKLAVSWIPELRMKYPLDDNINDLSQNIQVFFYNFNYLNNIYLLINNLFNLFNLILKSRMPYVIFIRLFRMCLINYVDNIHRNYCVLCYQV